MPFELNLTEFHIAFLKHLHSYTVEHIVIGGQAQRFHCGSATSDLDLWVNCSERNNVYFASALIEWSKKYPHHFAKPYFGECAEHLANKITPTIQVIVPDNDVLWKLKNGEIVAVYENTKVDVLFSLEQFDFSVCFDRAEEVDIDEAVVKVFSKIDSKKP